MEPSVCAVSIQIQFHCNALGYARWYGVSGPGVARACMLRASSLNIVSLRRCWKFIKMRAWEEPRACTQRRSVSTCGADQGR